MTARLIAQKKRKQASSGTVTARSGSGAAVARDGKNTARIL